jgi:hypothetical protein
MTSFIACTPRHIRNIKSIMGWAGHAASMGMKMNAHRVFVRSQKETDQQNYLNVDGSIVLKWVLDKKDRLVWIHLA